MGTPKDCLGYAFHSKRVGGISELFNLNGIAHVGVLRHIFLKIMSGSEIILCLNCCGYISTAYKESRPLLESNYL